MFHVVLYEPEIAPNTGNIIRTCFSIGVKLHIIEPISFDLHPKWLKRSAAGKHLSDIPHEIHSSYKAFCSKYQQAKIFYVTRYAQQLYSRPNYFKEYQSSKDLFFMFGRESTGIPKNILQNNLSSCLRIPMTPKSRSLNLANSVCIVMYEVLRQMNFVDLSFFEVQKGKYYLEK